VRRALACGAAVLLVAGLVACAPPSIRLPSGSGEPFPDFAPALSDATAGCRSVASLTAELALSGQAGGQKVRGRVTAGIARPSSIRLEGVAPFGPPAFILAADGRGSTLLLPRDHRVLSGESPGAILDALVGLDLQPADLLAILTGCVVPDPQAADGRTYTDGWARIDLVGGASAFLQRDPRQRWRMRAATRANLRLEYTDAPGGLLSAVRIVVSGEAGGATDLRIGLSQVENNAALGQEVFTVKPPPDATPITLAELRQAGPMGEKR
jgi:outer membrane lipoprotein-sorting protein